MLRDLAYTIVYVDDVDKSTAFYHNVLGIPIDRAVNGSARFTSNGAPVVLLPNTNEYAAGGGRVRLAFWVEDIDRTYRDLRARGVTFVAPPAEALYGRRATLLDPDGNTIDLIQRSANAADDVTNKMTVNEILMRSPEAMQVLEDHGIRICGGCIVLLNGTVQQTAEYSGLSTAEASEMLEELNEKTREHEALEQRAEMTAPSE